MEEPPPATIPDALIRDLHMARSLLEELLGAVAKLDGGADQPEAADLRATADAAYTSLWDHLRRCRAAVVALGRSTDAYDRALEAIGLAGTKSVTLEDDLNRPGVTSAAAVTEAFLELLPEVDWTQPPPRKSPGRGLLFAGLAAAGLAGLSALLGRLNREDAPSDSEPVPLDQLLALSTDQLAEALRSSTTLADDVRAEARAELERRCLAELPHADRDRARKIATIAATVELADAVLIAAAQRLAADASLPEPDNTN